VIIAVAIPIATLLLSDPVAKLTTAIPVATRSRKASVWTGRFDVRVLSTPSCASARLRARDPARVRRRNHDSRLTEFRELTAASFPGARLLPIMRSRRLPRQGDRVAILHFTEGSGSRNQPIPL